MALFKINKGKKDNLPTTYNEGYCYFTTDDGKFYIDTTNTAAGRIVLNAETTDTLTTTLPINKGGTGLTALVTPTVTWTNGTTSGPTLTIKDSLNKTSTAVAIPSASTTSSGIITTGYQRLRGSKVLEYPCISSNNTQWQGYRYYNSADVQVGEHWLDCGNVTNITLTRFYWRQYSPNTTANTTTTGFYEQYYLPSCTVGLTANKSYEIFTSKNYSTLDNRYLKLTGGTLSGSIHISHTTNDVMDTTTTNPRIIFSENGGVQPVALVYTDYNNYRGPHGLKVVGLDGDKSWFEVDGPIYANGGVIGNSSTATSTWHLTRSLPSAHSNFSSITYTVGQYAIGTGTDQVQKNVSSGNRLVISSSDRVVYDNGSVSNVQFLRFYWGETYWNELHMSPNHNCLLWRMVQNGTPTAFQQIWKEGDSVTGAVWNDYAEYRESDCQEFGRVLVENGDDSLSVSNFRLQSFAGISSDTWGFCQGETEKAKTPIAVAGRVLAYPYQKRENYKPGDVVCAAPNGTVDIMTRQEIIEYPDRIVGIVSCVPDYEEWGQGDRPAVKVDGRIWIKVK